MKRSLTLAATTVAAALLSMVSVAMADTVAYSVGGWGGTQFPGPVTPPANAPWGVNGYAGDTVELGAHSGTLDLSPGSSIRKINTLHWTIDYTYAGTATDPDAWSDLQFTFNALRNMTIDGVGGSISQVGTLDVTWDNDYLALGTGTKVSFIVQGFQVDVTPLGLAPAGGENFPGYPGGNPWTQPSRDVVARFDVSTAVVPLPAAAWMGMALMSSVGGVGLFRKRHQFTAAKG